MKDKLMTLFGGFGLILYYIITVLISVLPFVMIKSNFLLTLLFVFIESVFPPATVIFWIWGLVRAVAGVQDIWAIIYYILFAIAFLPFFVSILTSLFPKRR